MRRYRELALRIGLAGEQFNAIEQAWAALEKRIDDLALQRSVYADFFAYSPDAHLMTDEHGVIQDASRAVAAVFNAPLSNLAGKPIALYVAPDRRSELRRNVARLEMRGDAQLSWRTMLQPHAAAAAAGTLSVRRSRPGNNRTLWWRIRLEPAA